MAGSLGDWFKTPTLAERLRQAGVRNDLIEAASRTAFTRPSDGLLMAAEELLDLDEAVIALVEGRLDRRSGLLLLTTRRVLFRPSSGRTMTPATADLTDIMAVASQTRRGMGSLTLTTRGPGGFAGEQLVIDRILGTQADTLAAELRQAQTVPTTTTPQPERDPIDELIELRAMHRAGAVTDAEYDLRKRQLFERI